MPAPAWKDKALFTPGPLTTSPTVKQAMLRDLGSRDAEFMRVVAEIRQRLVALGGFDRAAYTAVIMQGSGTFSVEAVIASTIPPDGHLLVLVNGAYGQRMVQIAKTLKINVTALACPEDQTPDLTALDATLAADATISTVAVVHCETTTGIINPIAEIGRRVKQAGRTYFVDAMSSYGAVPLDGAEAEIDYLVSSANKCIEGVPGFGFIIARTAALLGTAGYARSLSLDLLAQYQGLEANGQFRFTPPTHALLAFYQALGELEAEGGVAGRGARYRANRDTLRAQMQALGFREYLAPAVQGYIITTYHYPEHPNFVFAEFYQRLSDKGYVIYPGKLSRVDCFRIGHVGRLSPADMTDLAHAIRTTLRELNIKLTPAAGMAAEPSAVVGRAL
jgi:2-aminoethylphosphonate-pyruvate transaminase